MARSRVRAPERIPDTDLEREIDGLKAAADESRALLMAGVQRYANQFRATTERVDSPLVRVEASTNPEDLAVLCRIPARTYDIARPEAEVDRKLGVDLYLLLKELVRGRPGPDLVVERGPGLGMAQFDLRTRRDTDSEIQARDITFVGELDHFHFKLTTLLRALKYSEAPIPHELEKEFFGVLIMYLTSVSNFYPNLEESPEVLVRALLDPSVWSGLIEAIESKNIPDPRFLETNIPYSATPAMQTLLATFMRGPRSFFREDAEDIHPLQDPEHWLGLRKGRTILGGDMGTFVPHLPPESVTLSYGVRSTAWYLDAGENPMASRQRIIELALATGHSLRRGGVDIDDWSRGFFDSAHYTGDLVAVAEAIARDPSLRGNTRLSVIWGPSDEHPDRWAQIPKSAVITRANRRGQFPDGKIRKALLRQTTNPGGELVRLTAHQMFPVGSGLEDIFRNADPQRDPKDTADAYHRRLAKMLADLRRDKP